MQRPTRRALCFVASISSVLACGASRIDQHTPHVVDAAVDDAGGSAIDVAATPRVEDAAPLDASLGEKDVSAPRTRCGNMRWVPKFCYVRDLGDPGATADADEEAWLTTHGAKAGDVKAQMNAHMLGAACRALSAGPEREDALFCMYHTQVSAGSSSSVYRGVQRVRIVTVRAKAVVVLLDVPFSFASFDVPGQAAEGDETEIFGLQIDARDAATKIVVSEPRSGACAAAAKLNADDITTRLQQKPVVPVEVETMRFDAKMLHLICSAAKTYAWTKGSYRSP